MASGRYCASFRGEHSRRPRTGGALLVAVFARRVLTPGPVVGQALNADKAATADEKKEALVMAEIVEMMHLATQVHDTILEDGDALDKLMLERKKTVAADNFDALCSAIKQMQPTD